MLTKLAALVLVTVLMAEPALATVACSVLTNSSSTSNATSYGTASVSPGADTLLLLLVSNVRNGDTTCANADVHNVAGNGLTWVEVHQICFSSAAVPNHALAVFRSMGSSPSSGAVTWDHGGNTQNNSAWAVLECTGVDTTGTDGSGAVVQAVETSDTAVTSLTVSLAAFGSADNATLSVFSVSDNIAITHEGTELFETQVSDGGIDQTLQAQFLAGNDTSPSASFASIDAAGIALEIKAAANVLGGGALWFP